MKIKLVSQNNSQVFIDTSKIDKIEVARNQAFRKSANSEVIEGFVVFITINGIENKTGIFSKEETKRLVDTWKGE